MKKFSELSAADFPGYDPEKIESWISAAKEANRNYLMFLGGLLALCVIVSLIVGTPVLPGLLLILVAPFLLFKKTRKMEKELGMTRKIVTMARRGMLGRPGF